MKRSFWVYCITVFFLFFFALDKNVSFSSDDMILIPAGEFFMGSNNGNVDEKPEHPVYLDAFYIDKYEVTNREYAIFLNAVKNDKVTEWINIEDKRCLIEKVNNLYSPKKVYDDYPVIGITWYGADSYAAWAGKRLPTEAEWEKAARGSDKRIYPWGMIWDPLNCANSFSGGSGKLMAVGSFPMGASPYGVMDMSGNVWEWCSDWYDKNYYTKGSSNNPTGPLEGKYKVMRGGSWFYSSPLMFRCTQRTGKDTKCKLINIGFRCVK